MKISPKATYFPWSGVHALKQHTFELILNLSIQEKAAVLAGELQAEQKLGPTQSKDGAKFVHGDWQLYRTSLVKNNLFNRYHWAELNALDIIPSADITATRFDMPRTLPDCRKVGLFLGASDEAKRPTPAFWGALVDELLGRNLLPVLFGGPAEKELGNEVARLAKGPALNLCGTLRLDELGAVGQTLGLFITPDTGPMHLAAWTGLKCLNLSMGNVNPWETGPYSPGHSVLRADMECAKGCWQCTRNRLHCQDSFKPGRIAALTARMMAGDGPAKLARLNLPGLNLFQTGKSDLGLYQLQRLDSTPPDTERLASRFWQTFFGNIFGLWAADRHAAAWTDIAENASPEADTLRGHFPEMGRQFKHGLKMGAILDEAFWGNSPAMAKPFTGYIHMYLENNDYSRQAWAHALDLLEQLITTCR